MEEENKEQIESGASLVPEEATEETTQEEETSESKEVEDVSNEMESPEESEPEPVDELGPRTEPESESVKDVLKEDEA